MKNKVIAIRVFFVITIVFLALAIGMHFAKFCSSNLIENIGLAVFGSSLVSLAISIIDYYTTKKIVCENFYLEYVSYINLISGINYFNIDSKEIIYSKYLTNLKMFWNIDASDKIVFVQKAKDEFATQDSWFEKLTDSDFQNYLDVEAKSFEEKLIPILEKYIDFSKYSLIKLGRCYGDFHFLFRNEKQHYDIYNQLYKPALELSRLIEIESSHFNDFVNGSGKNVYVMVCKLAELSEKLYKKEIEGKVIRVYAEKYNQLANNLEKFRCRMYKEEFKEQKFTPVYTVIKDAKVQII